MFNLNIPPSSLLGIDSSGLCSTPKTPEIVNSLVAMTNPLDYNFSLSGDNTPVSQRGDVSNCFNITQENSRSSCSASPLDSPSGTPSVQQTCSQLIKAGLKLSIQSKRKISTCDSSSGSEQLSNSKCSRRDEDCEDTSDDDSENKCMAKGLTPEDEDRRRRRRERNKIAATKCRMKKRERTQNLIKESEQLDTQNVDLKKQVRSLELERRKLIEMLEAHGPKCLHSGGFMLSAKLQKSPAIKYLAELELDNDNAGINKSLLNTNNNQRTAIPPMSTIKFSRSNGFKQANLPHQLSAISPTTPTAPSKQQQHQQQQQQLRNGYCKPSPTAHELGYLNSPSQENLSACLGALTPAHTTLSLDSPNSSLSNTAHQTQSAHAALNSHHHSLSDYIPNCENSLGLTLPTTPTASNADDNSLLNIDSVAARTLSLINANSSNEFVKNELVDSQSPYTTAQSAERFLFENNCESFVDIKHAVNLHPGSHDHTLNGHNNNNSNLLDFQNALMGPTNGIVPFHDQISIKNDYLHEADLLAQLTGDGGEFVDLDTGVAAAFMTNGGCLA